MRRILLVGLGALAGAAIGTSAASAQVFIRAPFVRVQTGPGVFVQTPFVTVAVPPVAPVIGPGPVYVVPPPSIYIPPTQTTRPQMEILPQPAVAPPPTPVLQGPPGVPPPPPAPQAVPNLTPPAPVAPVQAVSLSQFAANFKARAGTFEVDLINPITKQPSKVRFTLPEGTPKRVIVNSDEIEFRYGLFQFVRIEFTKNGAQVITRLGR